MAGLQSYSAQHKEARSAQSEQMSDQVLVLRIHEGAGAQPMIARPIFVAQKR